MVRVSAVTGWLRNSSRQAFKTSRSSTVHLVESNHALELLVPKCQARTFEAVAEAKRHCLAKLRHGSVTGSQVVVGNAALQVMDVAEADVAGEPL